MKFNTPTKKLSTQELIEHFTEMYDRYKQNAANKVPYTIAANENESVNRWNASANLVLDRITVLKERVKHG